MKTTFAVLGSLGVLTAFTAIIPSAAAQPTDIRQGLIAYWPMESHDGTTTPDATPFANTLTLAGAPGVGAGQFGNAFTFNGSSTYLITLHTPDNSTTGLPVYRAGSYTVAMWVKGAAQTAKYLFSEGNTTDNDTLLILQTGQFATNNNRLDVIIRNDAGTIAGTLVNHVVSTNVVFDNAWHHIAWVDDQGSAKLYVDGNLDPANFNYTPTGIFTFNTTAIGTLIRAAVQTTAIFNGQMDDVAIWERALSQAEVQQVRTSSLPTPIPLLAPLVITSPPATSVRALGESIAFGVRAVGNRPLGYQWFKDDVEIAGATSTNLTLTDLTLEDSGDYLVRVTNPAGTVSSGTATLTVVFALPPEITQQPSSQSVFTRSRVTLAATVTGSAPLEMQWRKNGDNVPGETNPALTLPSAALSDAGEYTLVVSNAAGSVTSQVATLTVTLRPPPPAELRIDFNNTGQDTPAETEAGFSTFSLAAPGFGPFAKLYGGAEVTLSGVGVSLAGRRRAAPLNSGGFTEEQLLRDFIFAADTAAGQGLDLAVEFLEPNAPYAVTIWSFDTGNNNRVSDWSANGASVFPGYMFSGNVLPASNEQYQLKFDVISDADGKVFIQGRRGTTASAANNVFLNALKVTRRELRIQKIEVVGFDLVLTIEALNPAATHRIEYKNSLNDPDWIEDPLAFFLPPTGNTLQVYVSLPDTATRFYRVVQLP
jgi:hypothetical protein